ncbi:hypothetical protein ACFQ1L_24620 [Phytohabitans flavus]|uniref:hypothetical protein n=1 Tax=Phytohabitans flavus TaxID=1076124 RepID=UPI00362ACC28
MAEISEENRALRSLVAIYRQLSGLAAQDADLGTVTQLVAERAGATAVVISQKMGIVAAAAPGESYPETARYAQENLIHPRLTPPSPRRPPPAGSCARRTRATGGRSWSRRCSWGSRSPRTSWCSSPRGTGAARS